MKKPIPNHASFKQAVSSQGGVQIWKRPRLLIKAAHIGARMLAYGYQKKRNKYKNQPLDALIAIEKKLENYRTQRSLSYQPARHVEVLSHILMRVLSSHSLKI